MRIYKNLKYDNDFAIIHLMQKLSCPNISVNEYRNTFHEIGKALGMRIKKHMQNASNDKIMLACTSEDADWLAQGIIETLDLDNFSLAVFWNERITFNKEEKIEYSPIVKSYIEPIEDCNTLIIIKSIISTSCVVRTQITRLYQEIKPKNILIVSPVMLKGADKSLCKEFPIEISNKFKFLTFAIDYERDEKGNIIPGVGGMVYPKLGLGNVHTKNKYIPELVKQRIDDDE